MYITWAKKRKYRSVKYAHPAVKEDGIWRRKWCYTRIETISRLPDSVLKLVLPKGFLREWVRDERVALAKSTVQKGMILKAQSQGKIRRGDIDHPYPRSLTRWLKELVDRDVLVRSKVNAIQGPLGGALPLYEYALSPWAKYCVKRGKQEHLLDPDRVKLCREAFISSKTRTKTRQ